VWFVKHEMQGGKSASGMPSVAFTTYHHESSRLLAVGWTYEQDVESDRESEQHSPYEQPLISCHVPHDLSPSNISASPMPQRA
jgi:hypothetical protein